MGFNLSELYLSFLLVYMVRVTSQCPVAWKKNNLADEGLVNKKRFGKYLNHDLIMWERGMNRHVQKRDTNPLSQHRILNIFEWLKSALVIQCQKRNVKLGLRGHKSTWPKEPIKRRLCDVDQ